MRNRCFYWIRLGPNLLITRLSTRRTKPNGQFRVKLGQIDQFMALKLLQRQALKHGKHHELLEKHVLFYIRTFRRILHIRSI